MSQVKKEESVISEGSGKVVRMSDLVDQHEQRSGEVKSSQSPKSLDVPFNAKDYEEAMSVNGRFEYEDKLPLTKKIFMLPFYGINILIALFYRFIFKVLTLTVLSKNSKYQDQRNWWSSWLFYRPSTPSSFLKANATSWKAVEYIYTWKNSVGQLTGYDRILSWFLLVENIIVTRNRLRSLKRVLFQEVDSLLKQGRQTVSIVSLAAGSARGPIEVVAYFLKQNPELLNHFTLNLADDDEEAFEFARGLAHASFPGLENRMFFRKMKISSKEEGLLELHGYLLQIKADINEVVGFTDYMTPVKAVKVISIIEDTLNPGGCFITNNRMPNSERIFLQTSVSWTLYNRNETQVMQFLRESNFNQILTLWDPTGIDPVYFCRKT